MLPVNRIGNGTLFSLRVQGAAVTTKTSDKNQTVESKIMNTTIVSAEAKARLTEAVRNYAPPASEKYRALDEVKESIIELRERKASYQTIRTILHDNAGIEVSHQTIARYCREVLDSARPKRPRQSKTPTDTQPASVQTELASTIRQPASHGHADRAMPVPKVFSAPAQWSPVAATESDSKGNPPILKAKAYGFRVRDQRALHSPVTRARRGRKGKPQSRPLPS